MLPLILGTVLLFQLLRAAMPRLISLYVSATTPKQANNAARTAAMTARSRQLSTQATMALWVGEALVQYSLTLFKRNTVLLHFKDGTIPGIFGYLLSFNQVAALYFASGVVAKQIQDFMA